MRGKRCRPCGLRGSRTVSTATHQPPLEPLEPYRSAVSIVLRLNNGTIEEISDGPTLEYAELYRAVNATLDRITSMIAQWIAGRGFTAKTVPASNIVDEVNLLGSVSHKAVARMAGIG